MIRSEIQNGLRSYLRSLAARRSNKTVTADDAHTYLSNKRVSGVKARLAYINSVLRRPTFKPSGTTMSTRPVARGRTITRWRAGK